jgi:hypothetical protein
VFTAQANFAETACQTHRAAAREFDGVLVGIVAGDSAFQPDNRGQAVAEVRRATEAQTAGAVAGIAQAGDALSTTQAGHGHVSHAKHGHLRGSSANHTQCRQGNQGFFHFGGSTKKSKKIPGAQTSSKLYA